MTGLDTNILLRYILQDDPAQSRLATRAVERLSAENPGYIPTIVLCELNWSLRSAYRFAKSDCVQVLERILSVAAFEIEHHDCCRRALRAYNAGSADFADYLIREISILAGCDCILTFDKGALKSAGFARP